MGRLAPRNSGTCLLFDGVNDKVVVSHSAEQLVTGGFTLSAWINPRSAGESSGGRIFDKSTDATAGDGFYYHIGASNNIRMSVNGGTSRVSAGGAAPNNTWTHVLVTVASDGTVTHYINGVVSGTPATTGALSGITTTNDLTIGNRSGATDRTFDGYIDEPRFWNEVLTAQQVSDLYFKDEVPQSGLIGEWDFNEGGGTVATDTSSSANNGTITGATYSTVTPHRPRFSARNMGLSGSFDGSTDGVQLTGYVPTAGFTFACWFKVDVLTNNDRLIDWSELGPSNGWYVNLLSTGSVQLIVTGTGITTVPAGSFKIGEWHHIAGTQTDTSLKVYFDGVKVGTTATSATLTEASGETLAIGKRSTAGTNFFNGSIKDFLLYESVLTEAQISDLYSTGTTPSGEKYRITFDNALSDTSGNANTVTDVATMTYTGDTPFKPRKAVRDDKASVAFNGNNTKVTTTTNLTAYPDNFTISAWGKREGTQDDYARLFDGGYGGGSGSYGFALASPIDDANTTRMKFVIRTTDDTSTNVGIVTTGEGWHHFVGTKDGITAKFYLDGVLVGSNTLAALEYRRSVVPSISGPQPYGGKIGQTIVFSEALTADEVSRLYHTNTHNNTVFSQWDLDEGAGTTANDSSGNSNTGTIANGSWSSDTPSKERKAVNGNLVKNGDFEYAPPFTAATSTGSGWIIGAAAPSSTNAIFDWSLLRGVAGVTAKFDSDTKRSGAYSLNISNDGTGRGRCQSQYTTTAVKEKWIKVLPNTSYTLSAWIKTLAVDTDGAFISIEEFDIDESEVGSDTVIGSKMTGTNDWTQKTAAFTTAATTLYLNIKCSNDVAGSVSTAWFDDIVLKPTTATERTDI